MSTPPYKRYADILVSFHFLWTLALIAGAIAMFFFPGYAMVQIVVMTFTLLISLPNGMVCPLTDWEEKLRRAVDPSYRNGGSYIAAYFNKIFRKHVPVGKVHRTVAGLYVVAYAAAIAILILHYQELVR